MTDGYGMARVLLGTATHRVRYSSRRRSPQNAERLLTRGFEIAQTDTPESIERCASADLHQAVIRATVFARITVALGSEYGIALARACYFLGVSVALGEEELFGPL